MNSKVLKEHISYVDFEKAEKIVHTEISDDSYDVNTYKYIDGKAYLKYKHYDSEGGEKGYLEYEEDWKLMGRTDYIVNKINSVIDKIKRDKQLHANYIDSIKIFTKTTTVKSKSASKKSMK